MRMIVIATLVTLVGGGTVLSLGGEAQACLWDYDTLAMEKRAFPKALDLITGKFLRHSTDYYQWRVKDRLAKLGPLPQNSELRLPLYDDLAVAYDKLGRDKAAIALMAKKEAIKAGLYQTAANLGTFYIHDRQFDEGLKHIKRALKINPDAHFGRERYQQYLVEYVQESGGGSWLTPVQRKRMSGKRSGPGHTFGSVGFAGFLAKKSGQKQRDGLKKEEQEKAIKGVLGMMRFGNFRSPILLSALGDLLLSGDHATKRQHRRLAGRAYLKASYEAKDAKAKELYRLQGAWAVRLQKVARGVPDGSLEHLEKTFLKELKRANRWYARVQSQEKKWIDAGEDVDSRFSKKYYRGGKKP
jgi:hypothetical protein